MSSTPTRVPCMGGRDLGGTCHLEVDLGWGGLAPVASADSEAAINFHTLPAPKGMGSMVQAANAEASGDPSASKAGLDFQKPGLVVGSVMGVRGNDRDTVLAFITEKPVLMCSCATWLGGRGAERAT